MFKKMMWCAIVFAAAGIFMPLQAAEAAKTDVKVEKPLAPDFDEPVASDEEVKKADSDKDWQHQLLWYVPNRLVDLADCFTVELGAGEVAMDLYLTRYATLGGGVGYSATLGWIGNERVYGGYTQRSWNGEFFPKSYYEIQRDNLFGTYNSIRTTNKGNANCKDMKALHEDPYAIGVKAAFWGGIKFQFHPVQFADFFCGLFFFDICDDDK